MKQPIGIMDKPPATDMPRVMLSEKAVLKIVPVARRTLRKWGKAATFPRAVPISEGRIAYYADEIAAWWTTEVSFMNPRTAVMVVHGLKEEDDPQRYQQLLVEMSRNGTAYDLGAVFGVKEVLDPRETREYLKQMLDTHMLRLSGGIGQHRLANWPTSY